MELVGRSVTSSRNPFSVACVEIRISFFLHTLCDRNISRVNLNVLHSGLS
jgi:hypothetical protein